MNSKKIKKIQLPEQAKLSEEEKKRNREITRERINVEIRCFERKLKFKEEQLKSGIVETRATNSIPGQPALIIDGYKDGIKPMYEIENDIDRTNQQINEFKRQLEDLDQAEEEDARETA